HLLLCCYLYYFLYSSVSVYNLSVRKYLFIAALLQPFICYFAKRVKTPRSSSSSSSLSHLALGIPTFGLLVTFYIGVLPLRHSIVFILVSYFYYTIILYLNSVYVLVSSLF